jgi:ankyrin repeat protein
LHAVEGQSQHMPTNRARYAVALIAFLCFAGLLFAGHKYKDDPRLSPLMNAAAHNDLLRIRDLLAKGADVKQQTARGETALYEAIEWNDTRIDNLPTVDALLQAGADPNEREILGVNALTISLTRDHSNPAVTLRLLQAGASVPRECGDGDSLLSLATQDSSLNVMRALIEKGAPINCRYRGESALYWAATNGHADRVALLLQSGADPTHQDLEAATCPHCESSVQRDFAKTRELLNNAIQSRNSLR